MKYLITVFALVLATMTFAQKDVTKFLGIPVDGLAVAGLLGIVTDFICTASITGLMHCELLIDADNLEMLDKSKLDLLRKKG